MKPVRWIAVGVVAALGVGGVASYAQTLRGTTLTPRLNPFNPDQTLSGDSWTRSVVRPTGEEGGGSLAFLPPSTLRPPFFPNPRSPYFPGPR